MDAHYIVNAIIAGVCHVLGVNGLVGAGRCDHKEKNKGLWILSLDCHVLGVDWARVGIGSLG